MNTILGFKLLEDEELEDHACEARLRDQMSEFHDNMMSVISISSLEEEEGDLGDTSGGDQQSILKAIIKVRMKSKSI